MKRSRSLDLDSSPRRVCPLRFRLLGCLTALALAAGCAMPSEARPNAGSGNTSGAHGGSQAQGGSGGVVGGASGAGATAGGGGAGSGGVGGSGGVAGSGGAAGSAGSAGSPNPFPKEELLDDDLIARAVLMHMSCYGDDGAWRTARTFRHAAVSGGFWNNADGLVGCLVQAKTCVEADVCMGFDLSTPDDDKSRCKTCDGDRAFYCFDGLYAADCSKRGMTCAGGRCVSAESCSASPNGCDASQSVVDCAEGRYPAEITRCAAVGLACAKAGMADLTCAGTGPACSSPTSETSYFAIPELGEQCSGDRLLGCFLGRQGSIDCSRMGVGYTCQVLDGVAFCGTANECNPETFGKVCDGDVAAICVGGKLYRRDCAATGMRTCRPKPGWAACDGRGG